MEYKYEGRPLEWQPSRIPLLFRTSYNTSKSVDHYRGAYNEAFRRRLLDLEGTPTVKDVIRIQDDLVKQFGLEGYRP